LVDRTAWRLLLNTALATLAVFLVVQLRFHVVAVVVFLAVLSGIYFYEGPERRGWRVSFWLLVAAGVVSTHALSLSLSLSLLSLVAFAVLFFVLSGLVNFIFRDRFFVHSIFNTALFLFLFLLVNVFAELGVFWIVGLVTFAVTLLLMRETLRVLGIARGMRVFAISGVLSLIVVEVLWLMQFLPLGVVNTAVFLTLFTFLARDGIVAHYRGNLNVHFVLRQLTFFVVLSLLVFAASRWSI